MILNDRAGRLRARRRRAPRAPSRRRRAAGSRRRRRPCRRARGRGPRQRRVDRRAHRAALLGARAGDDPLPEQQPRRRVAARAGRRSALQAGRRAPCPPVAMPSAASSAACRGAGPARRTTASSLRSPGRRSAKLQSMPASSPRSGDPQRHRAAQRAEDVGPDRDRQRDPAVALGAERADASPPARRRRGRRCDRRSRTAAAGVVARARGLSARHIAAWSPLSHAAAKRSAALRRASSAFSCERHRYTPPAAAPRAPAAGAEPGGDPPPARDRRRPCAAACAAGRHSRPVSSRTDPARGPGVE